jgi:hypothetical protein
VSLFGQDLIGGKLQRNSISTASVECLLESACHIYSCFLRSFSRVMFLLQPEPTRSTRQRLETMPGMDSPFLEREVSKGGSVCSPPNTRIAPIGRLSHFRSATAPRSMSIRRLLPTGRFWFSAARTSAGPRERSSLYCSEKSRRMGDGGSDRLRWR